MWQVKYMPFTGVDIKLLVTDVEYLKLSGFACKGAFNPPIIATSILWKLPELSTSLFMPVI